MLSASTLGDARSCNVRLLIYRPIDMASVDTCHLIDVAGRKREGGGGVRPVCPCVPGPRSKVRRVLALVSGVLARLCLAPVALSRAWLWGMSSCDLVLLGITMLVD